MLEDPAKTRLDSFLWSVRQFKTRSLSTEACKKNWVVVNGRSAKPSRQIKNDDIIQIKYPSHNKTIKVSEILRNRVSAKLVDNYIEDLTPKEEYIKEELSRKNKILYTPSSIKGRPSKKNRRDIEEFLNNFKE